MSASVTPKQYTMKWEGNEKNILSYMNRERKQSGQSSCEIALLANGIKRYAHKIVLILNSEFFRRYFEENTAREGSAEREKDSERSRSDDEIMLLKSNETCWESSEQAKPPAANGKVQTTIPLPGINPEQLDPVLEYMYTSRLALRAENVNEILFVGCLLQVTSVIEFCAGVLFKQPNWKSPLVSPRILNFVTSQNRCSRTDDTATAVTWASNGGRPVPHEIAPAKYVRMARTGAAAYTSDAGPTFQRMQFQKNAQSLRQLYSTFLPSEGRSSRQRDKRRSTRNRFAGSPDMKNTFCKEQNQEYSMALDPEELDRELKLSDQLTRSSQQRSSATRPPRQFSSNTRSPVLLQPLPTPVVVVRSYSQSSNDQSEVSKLSPGSASSFHSASPPIRTPGSSRYYENESSDSSPSNLPKGCSEEGYKPVAMFPQNSDCNRIWHAAYASALGFPVFHPGYPPLAFLNPVGRLGYGQSVTKQSVAEKPAGNAHAHSSRPPPARTFGEENPTARTGYSSSVAAVYATSPSSVPEYKTSRFGSFRLNLSKTCSEQASAIQAVPQNSRKISGLQDGSRIPCRPGFKRFCPSVIQHQNAKTENKNCHVSASTLQTAKRKTLWRDQRGDYGDSSTVSSKDICFARSSLWERKTAACDASSSVDITLNSGVAKNRSHLSSHVDDNTRKRKPLRFAQNLPSSENVRDCENSRSDNRFSSEKIAHASTRREAHCSSEDDIIARECHQVEGSDLDSDDSGRPCSV